jgi:hypothetical protein
MKFGLEENFIDEICFQEKGHEAKDDDEYVHLHSIGKFKIIF